jgi:hypothetical protein
MTRSSVPPHGADLLLLLGVRPPTWATLCVLAAVTLGACSATPSTDPGDYVGVYVFTPGQDPGMDGKHYADIVILRPESAATEIRFDKGTGHVASTETTWRLLQTTTPESVILGDEGSPIDRAGKTIRLYLSYDLNEYYEKIR